MGYQVDFLLPLKLQKIYYFGLCWKILLANQVAGFFTFDLFDLLILIPGGLLLHCTCFLIGLKSLNFQDCVKKLMGCFFARRISSSKYNVVRLKGEAF